MAGKEEKLKEKLRNFKTTRNRPRELTAADIEEITSKAAALRSTLSLFGYLGRKDS